MADLKQVQKDAPDTLEQFKSAIGTLSDILGTISKLTTLIGVGDLVGKLVKMFCQGNPIPLRSLWLQFSRSLTPSFTSRSRSPIRSTCSR